MAERGGFFLFFFEIEIGEGSRGWRGSGSVGDPSSFSPFGGEGERVGRLVLN